MEKLIEEKVELLCLLKDIHRRLAAGRSISPNARDIFLEEGSKLGAPTVTEYLAGKLADFKADDVIKAYVDQSNERWKWIKGEYDR